MFTVFHRVVNCLLLSISLSFLPTFAFSQSTAEPDPIPTENIPVILDQDNIMHIKEIEESQPMMTLKKVKVLAERISKGNLTADTIKQLVSEFETILTDPLIKSVVGESKLTSEEVIAYVRTLADNIDLFEQVYLFYKKAINYLDLQYQEYVDSSFIRHLERGLFEYSEDSMVAKYGVRGNRLVVSIQTSKDPKHKYLFYQYSNEEFLLDSAEDLLPSDGNTMQTSLDFSSDNSQMSPINSIVSELEQKQNKESLESSNTSPAQKFNEALAILESQEKINGFEVTTVRLGDSFEVLGLYKESAPKFFKDPVRYIKEYLRSIYEPPQFILGIVGAIIQCSVTALIYTIKGKTFAEQLPPLILTATFATFMGTFIGSYRNYVDKGPIYKRILKECVIGALFLYSFKISSDGLSSVSLLSLTGILNNIKILTVMYFSKLFKYPYTFIPRMSKDLGYYGTEGQATIEDPILHVKWNARNLHNQIIYNLVSFGLKIAAIIGVYITVDFPVLGETNLDVATMLFFSSPVIALIINHYWIENEYKKINVKYRLDPSPTHKKGLERREKIYNKVRGYIDTMKSIYYGTLGVLSGNYLLKRKEANLLRKPISEDMDYLTSKPVSQLSIKELKIYLKQLNQQLKELENSDDIELKREIVTQCVVIEMSLDQLIREAAIVRAVRAKINQKSQKIKNTVKAATIGCASLFSGFMQ